MEVVLSNLVQGKPSGISHNVCWTVPEDVRTAVERDSHLRA